MVKGVSSAAETLVVPAAPTPISQRGAYTLYVGAGKGREASCRRLRANEFGQNARTQNSTCYTALAEVLSCPNQMPAQLKKRDLVGNLDKAVGHFVGRTIV
eukprot:6180726-Pleurochrysis_carterae.AAC.1